MLVLAACGDDPVSYSQPVRINLKVKSAETVNAVVSNDKSITTESGNPYGKFVGDAEITLGRDPSRITVDHVDLLLGAATTGVTTLGEIFVGDVDLLFLMNDTNNTYPVGRLAIAADTGPGPVGVDTGFDSDEAGEVDFAKILGGSFKVVIRGPAAPEFASKGAEADLQATFTFAAFE